MTRRIALTILALVTVLLVLAVVPLGVLLTDRERTSFRSTAVAAARDLSSSAEETLSDHKPPDAMRHQLHEAEEAGQCAAVYDAAGKIVASTECDDAAGDGPRALASRLLAQPTRHDTAVDETEAGLTVAEPIGDAARPVGVAVLTQSLDPLDDRTMVVWGWLSGIAVFCLVAGGLVSVRIARWVGSPLREVDDAARQLGEGELAIRAPAGRGPQEVRRLAASFNTMAGRVESLVHGHRAVVADVSHQLRTPLAALRLRLDLLAQDADGDTAAELAGAQEEIARLSRLVDGLLAAARAESAVPRPVPVAVEDVVAERVSAWEPVARERRVELDARCRPGLTAFVGAGDLEQVLDNLIANALDAVPGGGRVRIEGDTAHGSAGERSVARLRVVDNGPGMTAEAREAAFRRFGNPDAKGSGLGLAIVHRLVTANGGAVRLEQTPGGGLTVVVQLPRPWRSGRDAAQ